jgi:hypothetical protein
VQGQDYIDAVQSTLESSEKYTSVEPTADNRLLAPRKKNGIENIGAVKSAD